MNNTDNNTHHLASEFDEEVTVSLPHYHSFYQTVNLIKAMGIDPQTWLGTGRGTGALVDDATK